MSWTDKEALRQICRIRDVYNIRTFVETGTFRGVNASVQSYNFDVVLTCEINSEYFAQAKQRLATKQNVIISQKTSPQFLWEFSRKRSKATCVLYYLDAHFYDETLPKEDRYVVLKELDSLAGDTNCAVVIHDFDSFGLGHLEYDGIPLNLALVKDKLLAINPNFTFYGNTLAGCDIVEPEDLIDNKVPGLEEDAWVSDNLQYVWSRPDKTYRGLLYATPTPLPEEARGFLKELK